MYKRQSPYSTIFLIRSNITPTDKEITVKAEIAKNIGGIICPINHLSIMDIEFQGDVICRIVFLISEWVAIFKGNLFRFSMPCHDYKILNLMGPIFNFAINLNICFTRRN